MIKCNILSVDNMVYMPYINSEQVRKTVDKFTIEFYERENGAIPVEEFLLNLDKKMRAKRCEKNEKI